jgi:hypothetical protein
VALVRNCCKRDLQQYLCCMSPVSNPCSNDCHHRPANWCILASNIATLSFVIHGKGQQHHILRDNANPIAVVAILILTPQYISKTSLQVSEVARAQAPAFQTHPQLRAIGSVERLISLHDR